MNELNASRKEIVRVARSYIGTPWHHMARKPGVGMDCAGLLICALRETGGVAPDFDVPSYLSTPDGRSIQALCEQHMRRIEQTAMQPGDVLLVALESRPQHLGILGDYRHGGLSIIHSASNARPPAVIETRLMFSRALKFVAAYVMPGVE